MGVVRKLSHPIPVGNSFIILCLTRWTGLYDENPPRILLYANAEFNTIILALELREWQQNIDEILVTTD